jgi:hypothetical protein
MRHDKRASAVARRRRTDARIPATMITIVVDSPLRECSRWDPGERDALAPDEPT